MGERLRLEGPQLATVEEGDHRTPPRVGALVPRRQHLLGTRRRLRLSAEQVLEGSLK